jgi:hypothetical protein
MMNDYTLMKSVSFISATPALAKTFARATPDQISIATRSTTMKPSKMTLGWITALLALTAGLAQAFDSSSTGADGAFNPTVNTTVQLPPNGVFNYTTVNIPAGVTVRYLKNTTNTPVTILASGNVTVAGVIDIAGTVGVDTGASGTGNLGDDGVPGKGGPGGYDGGRGGVNTLGAPGGGGLGPGGGGAGIGQANCLGGGNMNAGAGGGYGAVAGGANCAVAAGTGYGSALLLPLIGGSGGGGGAGNSSFGGAGGGGGGGAMLIASSGTVNLAGSILADGGRGGNVTGPAAGGGGGGGSGGAIRIVGTTIVGNGILTAIAGAGGSGTTSGGAGAVGRIRLEAENITRTATSNPVYAFGTPGSVFVAGAPTLAITTIAGVPVPASPTGVADVPLPSTTANPVTIEFATTNVPVGSTVRLTVTPAAGAITSVNSSVLTGTTASATASAQVTLPAGPSTLQGQLTYTVVASLGDALRHYAGNERVERIQVSAAVGSVSRVTLITVSGKEFEASPEAMRIAALGG